MSIKLTAKQKTVVQVGEFKGKPLLRFGSPELPHFLRLSFGPGKAKQLHTALVGMGPISFKKLLEELIDA